MPGGGFVSIPVMPETKRNLYLRKGALGMKTYSDTIDYLLSLDVAEVLARTASPPKSKPVSPEDLIEKSQLVE